MIVLLGYSTNLYASNQTNSFNPPTGEVVILEDSVLISYNDLRIVNSKLIELEYTKQKNIKLNNIIYNDSILISNYKVMNNSLIKTNNKLKTKNKISFITALVAIIGFGISLIK